jgi:hypothetical protein
MGTMKCVCGHMPWFHGRSGPMGRCQSMLCCDRPDHWGHSQKSCPCDKYSAADAAGMEE